MSLPCGGNTELIIAFFDPLDLREFMLRLFLP